MRCFLGIDPGLRGGIAALDATGAVIGTWPMPVAGGEINAAGLADLLRCVRCLDGQVDIARVCLEKVGAMPKQGVASTFAFGTGWGIVRGVCTALSVSVVLVPATVWKKRVLVGFTHDKNGALRLCASRWPTAELVLPGCRVPHDGIADALCLAEYGRMTA
jgi:crossover junction endodeoxyribonuclease RuvC